MIFSFQIGKISKFVKKESIMKNVAVIGAGTMGNGIAHVFAQFGYTVNLIDVSAASLEKALATIAKNLDRQVAKGALTEEEKTATLNNLTTFTTVKEGVQGVQLVVEAATENIDLKLKIFKELDEVTDPSVILATNTSSISITKIASVTNRADKVIGMHFMNPVPVMKLVEIIRGYNELNKAKKSSKVKVGVAPPVPFISLAGANWLN